MFFLKLITDKSFFSAISYKNESWCGSRISANPSKNGQCVDTTWFALLTKKNGQKSTAPLAVLS